MGSLCTCMWVCGFAASGFEQSSECALMFRLQLVTASKVVSVSEWCVCVCATKESKSKTVLINDEMKMQLSENRE